MLLSRRGFSSQSVTTQIVHSLVLVVLFAASSEASNYQVIYSFTGSSGGSANPISSVTVDGSTLYGMTMHGGSAGLGTIFKIGTDGKGYSLLHPFAGGTNDGSTPLDSLTLVGSTLYGTTESGGAQNYGVCFRIGTDGNNFGLLHSFANNGDGKYPDGHLTLDGSTLYGTDRGGGSNIMGYIFKVQTNGSGFTTLHAMQIPEGVCPHDGLILHDSILYGTAIFGGTSSPTQGTVFKMNTNGSSVGVVHSFTGDEGRCPYGSLTLVGSTLYGTTSEVDINQPSGTIFKVNTDGTGFDVLHSFAGGDSDGFVPHGSLTLVGSELYGTTVQGGSANLGTIFKIGLDGSNFTVLHSFLGGTDGEHPGNDLTLSGSTLYGMATSGGSYDKGIIFSFAVPEPSTLVLVGFGAIGLFGYAWRRSKNRD
jgi:uncharacterized repeat protein (TIGR03803 family)